MKYKHYPERIPQQIASGPFIFGMIIPLAFLDICLEMYHHVCFPLYGLPFVKRSSYIRIDRHKLSYLNRLGKINCTYCGYANGLLRYAVAIAGETEGYWCGIKHSPVKEYADPPQHADFIPFGDKEAFQKFTSRKEYSQEKNEVVSEKG